MNAGLLGEHLASPRTATKTNQNTALEPNKKTDSAQPSEDGFAAYVAKDADAPGQDAPNGEDAVGTTASAVPTPDAAPAKMLDGELIGLTAAPVERAQTNGIEAKAATVEQNKATTSDLTKIASGAPDSLLPPGTASTEITGEVISEDPRTRAAANLQDGPDVQDIETIKLTQTPATGDTDAAADRPARAVIEARMDPDSIDAEALRSSRSIESVDARLTSDTQVRIGATDNKTLDQITTPLISRDSSMFSPDPTVTIGLTASGSAPGQVNAGLTPTAAAIPVAAPSDLTSIILNAAKNGADPQEQLVVQLDPPELGRVMIDFKFDAQGVQQITITSENPEALKRLRELHFELTQALRDNGLSDQNMSFRQQAGDQSQQAWQHPDQQRSNAPLNAAEERRASLSVTPTQPNVQARDRLDLLL
jgi:flagellar hook-length control protein FliK